MYFKLIRCESSQDMIDVSMDQHMTRLPGPTTVTAVYETDQPPSWSSYPLPGLDGMWATEWVSPVVGPRSASSLSSLARWEVRAVRVSMDDPRDTALNLIQ